MFQGSDLDEVFGGVKWILRGLLVLSVLGLFKAVELLIQFWNMIH